MDRIVKQLKAYIDTHPFDPGDSGCETVLDLLYQAYAESNEINPLKIREVFTKLDYAAIFPWNRGILIVERLLSQNLRLSRRLD